MLHQTVFYLLVFTFGACFGIHKLTTIRYGEFEKKSQGGAVFETAPSAQYKIKGTSGAMYLAFESTNLKVRGNDGPENGVHMTCVWYKRQPSYRRLSIRLEAHVYTGDVELDEFVVTACNKGKLENMFVVSKIGANKYTLAFKDTETKCFKREMEVTEEQLTVTVRRTEPVQLDCSEMEDFLTYGEGSVLPRSWIENGDLVELPSEQWSKFQIAVLPVDNSPKSTFYNYECKRVTIEEQTYRVVTVFFKGIPIDRMFAKACGDFLDRSIDLEKVKRSAPNEIYVSYLNMENRCLRRKYEVVVEGVSGDDFVRSVTVKRHEPTVAICTGMKLSCATYRTTHRNEV